MWNVLEAIGRLVWETFLTLVRFQSWWELQRQEEKVRWIVRRAPRRKSVDYIAVAGGKGQDTQERFSTKLVEKSFHHRYLSQVWCATAMSPSGVEPSCYKSYIHFPIYLIVGTVASLVHHVPAIRDTDCERRSKAKQKSTRAGIFRASTFVFRKPFSRPKIKAATSSSDLCWKKQSKKLTGKCMKESFVSVPPNLCIRATGTPS